MSTVRKKKDDTVTVRLPRLSGMEECVYVSVNNTGYCVRRGEICELPRAIAAELMRGEAAREQYYATRSRLLRA